MQFSITKNGKDLSPSLYSWDETTKTFSTDENGLVLDFSEINDVTFKTGSNCIFKTGSGCTFKTLSYCTFNTLSYCIFKTLSYCTFDTGDNCTFETKSDCTFDTLSHCTFKTGSDCTFDTGPYCTFETKSDCTFQTGSNCVLIRRDIFEVITIPIDQEIKIKENVKGYQVNKKHSIMIDDKKIELSNESYNELKKFFMKID